MKIVLVILLVFSLLFIACTQPPTLAQSNSSLDAQVRQLQQEVVKLQSRISSLENRLEQKTIFSQPQSSFDRLGQLESRVTNLERGGRSFP